MRRSLLGVVVLALLLAIGTVSAQNLYDAPCTVIKLVWRALKAITPTLVAMMFVYGGLKYIYSADDPGGRKAAIKICEHAILGGILWGIAYAVTVNVVGVTLCPGMTYP